MSSTPKPGASPPLPASIGKYKILERIGRGAMGVVYSARDEIMDRVVALKVMAGDLEAEPDTRARFYREAKVGGQLLHRNITTVFDLGESEGRLYMVMELLRGQPLNQFLARPEGVSLEMKVDLMIQLCEGLAAAHSHGVYHRDIKPSNLYVLDDGTLKILDFGIARLATSTMTATGSIVGTPDYMSPEQTVGSEIDQRSDIFSAGALFYAMLSGNKPFASPDLPTVLRKVQREDPPPITQPDVPAGLVRIVMKALAKKKEDRPQSARELASALVQFRREWEAEARNIAERAHAVYKTIEALIEEQSHSAERLGLEKPPVPDPVLSAIHDEYPMVADRGPDALLRIPFKRDVITAIAARLDARKSELEQAVNRLHAAALAVPPAMPPAVAPAAEAEELPTLVVGSDRGAGATGSGKAQAPAISPAAQAAAGAEHDRIELRQALATAIADGRRAIQAGRFSEAEAHLVRAAAHADELGVAGLREEVEELQATLARSRQASAAEANRLAESDRRQARVAAHLAEAERAWLEGDNARARDEAAAALAIDPRQERAVDLMIDGSVRLRQVAARDATLSDARAALAETRSLLEKQDWAKAASRAAAAAIVAETSTEGRALLLDVLQHESDQRIENLRLRTDRERRREADRLLTLARTAQRAGDWAAARSAAETVLVLDPGNAEARTVYRQSIHRTPPAAPVILKADPRATGTPNAAAPDEGATVLVPQIELPAPKQAVRNPQANAPAQPVLQPAASPQAPVSPAPGGMLSKLKPWVSRGRHKGES